MTAAPTPALIDGQPVTTAVVRGRVPMDELRNFFDRSFGQLGRALGSQGVAPTGPGFARYHGAPAEVVDLEVGFPTNSPVTAADGVEPGSLPGGRIATATYVGGYDGLGATWGGLEEWLGQQGLRPSGDLWEVYVTEPGPDVDPATLRTDVFWRIED